MARPSVLMLLIAAALVGSAVPANAKGTTSFLVSGGDLRHPVSFTSDDLSVPGEWTRDESHLPPLSGPRYLVKVYDPDYNPHHIIAEWMYVPEASGAIPIMPKTFAGYPLRALDGGPLRWIAFTPTFNAAFRGAIHSPPFDFHSFAIDSVMLVLLVAVVLSVRSVRRAKRFGLGMA